MQSGRSCRRYHMSDAFVRESLLQEQAGNKLRCNVCARRCVIPIGGQGWCRTRENRDGTLLTTLDADVTSFTDDTTMVALIVVGSTPPEITYELQAFNAAGKSKKVSKSISCFD